MDEIRLNVGLLLVPRVRQLAHLHRCTCETNGGWIVKRVIVRGEPSAILDMRRALSEMAMARAA